MAVSVKFKGHNDLAKALRKLPPELAKSAERTALREGIKPVAKQAKSNAAKRDGLLAESIGVTVRKTRIGGKKVLTARAGPRTGFVGRLLYINKNGRAVYAQPEFYSHLVEYGTSHSAAKPFIRPAIETTKGAVIEGMASGYEKGLSRAINRVKSRK